MLIRLDCPRCGHSGDELADGRAESISCARCQARFALRLVPVAEPTPDDDDGPADEPHLASWLGAQPLPAEAPSETESLDCFGCGYEGPMVLDPATPWPVCPACGRSRRILPAVDAVGNPRCLPMSNSARPVQPARYQPTHRELPCPECGEPLTAERGKTVICPACNSFLGCLYAETTEKRHWWQG